MPEETVRPHYSASALQQYLRCPAQRGYLLTVGPQPPGLRLVEGSVVHQTVADLHRSRIGGDTLTVPEIQDLAATNVRAAFQGEIRPAPEEMVEYGIDSVAQARGAVTDRVVRMSDHYARWIAPTVDPDAVEETIDVLVPGEAWMLRGIIDLRTKDGWVEDLKTKAKPPKPGEARESLQLGTYWILHRARWGTKPAGLRFRYVVAPIGGPVLNETQETQRTRDDAIILLRRFALVADGIQRGYFPPCHPSTWCCTPRWCGYYETTCEWVRRGKQRI